MKYAIGYYRSFRYGDDVDEICFKYKGTENILDILTWIKAYQRATILLNQVDIEEILESLLIFQQEHPNFAVKITRQQEDWIPTLKEFNIAFMFIEPAVCMEDVAYYYAEGVSDILIAEELCFNLKNLQGLRKKGIQIRVYPDVAQCKYNKNIPEITKFFIRPEDLDIYEKYIDILEFYRIDSTLNVTYEIYKQRRWVGQLEDLIYDLNVDIDNTTIVPIFGECRVDCCKKCLGEGGNCHICFRTEPIANQLAKNDLHIVHKRVKDIKTEDEFRSNEIPM